MGSLLTRVICISVLVVWWLTPFRPRVHTLRWTGLIRLYMGGQLSLSVLSEGEDEVANVGKNFVHGLNVGSCFSLLLDCLQLISTAFWDQNCCEYSFIDEDILGFLLGNLVDLRQDFVSVFFGLHVNVGLVALVFNVFGLDDGDSKH